MTKGWHNADVIAGLRKKGTSMAALSRANGLSSSTLVNTLTQPWPKGEYLIAEAPGVHPAEIWPERYIGEDGVVVVRRKLFRGVSSKVSSLKIYHDLTHLGLTQPYAGCWLPDTFQSRSQHIFK